MRVYVSGWAIRSESVGIFKVSTADESGLQLRRNVVVRTTQVCVLVSFNPLHWIHLVSFIKKCVDFFLGKYYACIEGLPFAPLSNSGLAKTGLDLGRALVESEVLVAVLGTGSLLGLLSFLRWN